MSYALGQGATMISALWGLLVWKEFAGANSHVKMLLTIMIVLFLVGLGMVSVAPLIRQDKRASRRSSNFSGSPVKLPCAIFAAPPPLPPNSARIALTTFPEWMPESGELAMITAAGVSETAINTLSARTDESGGFRTHIVRKRPPRINREWILRPDGVRDCLRVKVTPPILCQLSFKTAARFVGCFQPLGLGRQLTPAPHRAETENTRRRHFKSVIICPRATYGPVAAKEFQTNVAPNFLHRPEQDRTDLSSGAHVSAAASAPIEIHRSSTIRRGPDSLGRLAQSGCGRGILESDTLRADLPARLRSRALRRIANHPDVIAAHARSIVEDSAPM